LLADWLEEAGYRVTLASTGSELVSNLADAWLGGEPDSQPALVVTDNRMPEFDGLMVVQAVHLIDPAVPFVLITGFGSVALRRGAAWRGPVTVLDKPLPRERLLQAVADSLA